MQSSILFPISFVNIGGGIGITYKSDAIYDSKGIYPNVFITLEIGNGEKRTPVSGIISFGITENLIPIKGVPYISGGPCFNFKSHFEKVNISINPYMEYYTGRHDMVTYSGGNTGPIATHHWVKFTTLTYNISVIIQLNHF